MLERLLEQIKSAKAERIGIETIMRECFDLTHPMLGVGLQGNTSLDATSALYDASSRKSARIYDSTQTDAVRQLASLIVSGMVPSNTRWFDLDVAQDPEFRHAWLDDTADAIWREIHTSNFDTAIFDLVTMLIIGGYGAMYQGYDVERASLEFDAWPIWQTFVCESRAGGPADIVYRVFSLTPQQALSEYGADNLSEEIRTAANTGGKKMYEFVHAIYPRQDGIAGSQSLQKPVASVHIDVSNRQIVRESGFDEMPLAVPRWKKIANSAYATGPVYDALPDIKTLQDVVKFKLANAEMAVAGMWGAVDDGVINPSSIKVGPRQIVVMSSPESFFPLKPPSDIGVAFAEIDNLRMQVRKTMLVESMQLPQGGNQTATEVNVRVELMRQLLGPVFGRLQSELLNNVVQRAFGLLLRSGKVDAPPEELSGATLNVRFVSPLARSQRLGEVAAMDRFEMGLMQLSQVKPDVLDTYDFEMAASEKSWLLGVPQKLMRSDRDIKKIRQARADAAAAQQEQAMQDEIAVQTVPKQLGG